MKRAVIAGTGSYVPENRVTNDDMALLVETSDEWIASRTGIRERRISTGENTSDLACEAAKRALQNAGLDAGQLDLIICATITPDSFMPSVACMVQEGLGAGRAAAFDLSAACSGLVYGMACGASFIESGMFGNILVIGAETLSKTLDFTDRSTCVLFGDGAGAVVLQASDTGGGISGIHLLSDGSKQDYLRLPALPLKKPGLEQADTPPQVITMKGQEVFKFAVRSITEHIRTVLSRTQVPEEEIKYIITHQANNRIIEQAARSSGIPDGKFYRNLDRYGNTSAASIGIALDEMARKGLLESGDKILLVGFGGGMTSGALLVEWS
ncbi:3-oxoacyl-[acyl-carrier-protein] synthase-3 [Anaerotaenia torta]|uniref:beta-ketoacyl-ACP synthase III n=1 Tax=Anaerotaenia torta TaxID=433293 RepID=UPI003D21AEBF